MNLKIFSGKFWKFIIRKLFLIAIGVFVILTILILILQLSSIFPTVPSLGDKEAKTAIGNRQIPNGPLHDVWGTITSISTTSVDRAVFKQEEGIVTLKSDYGKEYVFNVDDNTLIHKYSVSQKIGMPALQEKYVFWKNLKVGDRINCQSSDDFLKIFNPKVGIIELYIYE
jgi:hypothetical protein